MIRTYALHRLDVFYEVAQTGSFSQAALALNISGSMASQHISKLERQLDVKLFHRNTRVVRLTEAGKILYQASDEVFDRLNRARNTIDEVQRTPRGLIRISSQSNFAELYLIPLLAEFQAMHKAVSFDLNIDDQVLDLREKAIDVSFTVGRVQDSDYYATKLMGFDLILCASPDYLKRHTTPTRLDQLLEHTVIGINTVKEGSHISFYNAQGQLESVPISKAAQTNSGLALKAMLCSGIGCATIPDFIVRDKLKSGELVQFLSDYTLPNMGIYAVCNQQLKKESYTVRSFVRFMRTAMKDN